MSNNQLDQRWAEKEINRLREELSEMTRLANSFLCDEIDYMLINKLGDPEQKHNVKWARRLGLTVFMPPIGSSEPSRVRNEIPLSD